MDHIDTTRPVARWSEGPVLPWSYWFADVFDDEHYLVVRDDIGKDGDYID